MELNFEGKRALVTGASRGIGKEIAKALTVYGAEVVALSNEEEELAKLQSEYSSIETVCVDLTDWNATKSALEAIRPADLLVNSAGVVFLEPLTKITEKSADITFDVNVKAMINVTQEVAKSLLSRKRPGAIVNISSQASMVGLQDHLVYCASKGAVDALTRAAALELGPHNIRVNSVNPTAIMTDMGKHVWSDPKKSAPFLSKVPLRRFGEVNEVVDVVLFLLSDRASLVHGCCLPIDGGYVAT